MLNPKFFRATNPAPAAAIDNVARTAQTTTAQPSGRPHRTKQQPQAKTQAASTAKRTSPKSDSLMAIYVRLTPILEDNNTSMRVDDSQPLTRSGHKATDKVKDPKLCCIYCHDIGSFIWRCTRAECRIPVCVSKGPGDHGCIDASPDKLTGDVKVEENMFLCPRCHRAAGIPIMYHVQGYSIRQDFFHRNYFPLLAIFLSWSGFGSSYASNIVKASLLEHFNLDPTRINIASRAIKAGNNRPSVMTPHFEWLAKLKYEGNMLIFINSHSDTTTGNLIVSGNAQNPVAVPIHELLTSYIGDNNLKLSTEAISAINKKSGVGPCVRGLVICCCGSTGRLSESANLLNRLVERDVFDFVLTFAGVSTIDSIVVPALNRFIENVYVFDMHIWDAMEESFGEDRHALNQSPVYISFATINNGPNGERNHVVDARVMAYSNIKDGRPWGLDIYRCWNVQCQAPAYNMIFHVHGKQYYGQRWVETKLKYTCLQCKMTQKGITCPSWVHAARSQNYGRVWYQWPLTSAQRRDIGIIE